MDISYIYTIYHVIYVQLVLFIRLYIYVSVCYIYVYILHTSSFNAPKPLKTINKDFRIRRMTCLKWGL